jgi:hypothetical protein
LAAVYGHADLRYVVVMKASGEVYDGRVWARWRR